MGIRDFIQNIKFVTDGISYANKHLIKEVKEVAIQTKRDIISEWKREAPILGETAEKVENAVRTLKNLSEQIPDPTLNMKKTHNFTSEENIKKAMHLKVSRLGYSHHALSINKFEVIHYQSGEVVKSSIEDFSKGGKIQIVNTHRSYEKEVVMDRAMRKLGDRNYNLIFNNCEHFVVWCLQGD